MPFDERVLDLLDQLREGRGEQNQKNKELYRRMGEAEIGIRQNDANMRKLDSKIDGLFTKVLGAATAVTVLITAIVELIIQLG